ncbi:MAG TPA: DNA repair protein RecO [Chloroflexota bacterium]|jgi:DNA repair protein RecO (recombination protein O)|nr:DNA repair protein RecO [Chloroflexota bacterium]
MRLERVYRTEGIVLRRQDFGEADRIITLYSPTHGKIRAIGKGVRRTKSRVGGHVELFTHVNVLVAQGRNLDIITQAEARGTFAAIRDDLWRATYACYCAELVDRLTEERLENRAIFDLLLLQLGYLNGAAEPGQRRAELSVRTFELRLLGVLGYAPELFRCVECGEPLKPEANRISASGGGTVCAGCSPTHPGARPLSVNAIKAMRLMSAEPYGVFQRLQLPAETAAEIEGALRAHINFILERQLRTAEFLDRLKASERALLPSAG